MTFGSARSGQRAGSRLTVAVLLTALAFATGWIASSRARWKSAPTPPRMQPNAGLLGPSCDPYNLQGDGGTLLKASPRPDDEKAVKRLRRRAKLLQDLMGKK